MFKFEIISNNFYYFLLKKFENINNEVTIHENDQFIYEHFCFWIFFTNIQLSGETEFQL